MGLMLRLVTLFCVAVASLSATPQLLLVDRSGSTKPYMQDGVLPDLVQKVRRVCRSRGRLEEAVFATGVQVVAEGDMATPPEGIGPNWTYLDEAANFAIHGGYPLFWVITDNVQDQPDALAGTPAGGIAPDAGQTKKFYDRLRGDRVQRVVIFPILHEPGRPGLAVYAILLAPAWREEFDAEVQQFVAEARTYQAEPLLMKPLDREAFEVEYLDMPAVKKGKVIHQAGQYMKEKFRVGFRSHYGHLCIQSAVIRQPTEEEARRAQLEQMVDFPPITLLHPEHILVNATPTTMDAICPGQTSALHIVEVDFGRVKLHPGWRAALQAAIGRPRADINYDVPLMITVEQAAYRFGQAFLAKYNAASLAEARQTGKVYGIKHLPELLAQPTTDVFAKVPLQFQVTYPWWPAALLVLGFLAVVGLLVLIVRQVYRHLKQPRPWHVQALRGKKALPAQIDRDGRLTVDGRTAGTVRDNSFQVASGVGASPGASGPIQTGKKIVLSLPGVPETELTFFRGKPVATPDRAPVLSRR
jgi:hypothetical protein